MRNVFGNGNYSYALTFPDDDSTDSYVYMTDDLRLNLPITYAMVCEYSPCNSPN